MERFERQVTRARRRREITIETRQIVAVRGRAKMHRERVFCKECAGESEMLLIQDAARVANLSQRHLFRQVEAGVLHSIETPDGQLSVCLNLLQD